MHGDHHDVRIERLELCEVVTDGARLTVTDPGERERGEDDERLLGVHAIAHAGPFLLLRPAPAAPFAATPRAFLTGFCRGPVELDPATAGGVVVQQKVGSFNSFDYFLAIDLSNTILDA